MGSRTKPSFARLKVILARQLPARFGASYFPSMLATREEAPSLSRASEVPSPSQKRMMHAMSPVEAGVLVLFEHLANASIDSDVRILEFHEQAMIPFSAAPHPYSAHPASRGHLLKPMPGSLQVADDLGYLKYHPTCIDDGGTRVPFPLLADVLGFLEDAKGPYCKNFNCKDRQEQFLRPIRGKGSRRHKPPSEAVVARHAIEEGSFGQADIPTLRVTAAHLNPQLVCNLRGLLRWQCDPFEVETNLRQELVGEFRESLKRADRPLDVWIALSARHRLTLDQIKIAFYKSVWQRELRLDLFQSINPDEPMQIERADLLTVYSGWLQRSA